MVSLVERIEQTLELFRIGVIERDLAVRLLADDDRIGPSLAKSIVDRAETRARETAPSYQELVAALDATLETLLGHFESCYRAVARPTRPLEIWTARGLVKAEEILARAKERR